MEIFALRLKLLLDSKGITSYRLHKDINYSQTAIANWLNCKSAPDAKALVALADYFDVSTDYLLGRTDKQY